MVQGDRPRHQRQPSRITTLLSSRKADGGDLNEHGRRRVADDATVAYVKRILCSKPISSGTGKEATATEVDARPLEEVLPPLTSQNDLDVQLYAIIAVILSQFVQTWYNKITPDSDFVGEIVQIIAHCTRGLEERMRHADLETLLLDEVPALVDAHLNAVQCARDSCRSRKACNFETSTRTVYQSLRPHNALSPTPVDEATTLAQRENERDWSQLLVNAVVPLLLPPEDLQNPCLSVLVSEVFSEMIIRNAVLGKSSEPWLLWEGVTKAIYTLRPNTRPSPKDASSSPASRLEQYGLLSAEEQLRHDTPNGARRRPIDAATVAFWSTLQYAALVWTLLRAFVIALMQTSSIQPRSRRVSRKDGTSDNLEAAADGTAPRPPNLHSLDKRPVVSMRIWSCVSRLMSLPQRMPWLFGCLTLLQWLSIHGPGQLCCTNSALDRLMSAQVHEKVLNPALLPPMLQAIREALFPSYALAPPRVPPTSDEVAEIKRECARVIVEVLPEPIAGYYFATKQREVVQQDVEDTLDLFGDAYINKHLIVAALELIVVRLFPELMEATILE